jgi:hypothetical protein
MFPIRQELSLPDARCSDANTAGDSAGVAKQYLRPLLHQLASVNPSLIEISPLHGRLHE